MNPLDQFQNLKPMLLEDVVFMENLKAFAFEDPLMLAYTNRLEFLGQGNNNRHFRIGKLGDFWIASRQFIFASDAEESLAVCDNYMSELMYYHTEGLMVPRVCGGVRALGKDKEKYFLLVEDLTRGGSSDFVPAERSGGICGMLDGVQVYHDFEDLPSRYDSTGIKYMKEDKLIILRN